MIDSSPKLSSLSFVFPMYNELGNIDRCVAQALQVGYRMTDDLEIVIVDDASTDGSGALADRLAERHPELKVVHHVVNRKLGGAIKTGLSNASKDWALYVDSDLPIDLDESMRAVPLALGSHDMVVGWRRNRSEGVRREIMSWVYNRLIRVVFGLEVRDVNFAFKMIRREFVQQIRLESEGSFIDAELLIRCRRLGARIAELGFDYHPRTAGVSTLAGIDVVLKILVEMRVFLQGERGQLDRNRPAQTGATLTLVETPSESAEAAAMTTARGSSTPSAYEPAHHSDYRECG